MAEQEIEDPFLWLEEVEGQRALAWVRRQNARSLAVLEADPRYPTLQAEALAIATASDRIPYPGLRGGAVYNLWQDATHVRGLWRRTTTERYRTASPEWETLLDLDALAEAEGVNWIYSGAQHRWPDYGRSLISLSDGGKDAVEIREFDLPTKRFPADGFRLPEGKQVAAWRDPDTLLVARDWGAGTTTEAGYAFVVKRLERGRSLDTALEVFRGTPKDVSASPLVLHDGDGRTLVLFQRAVTFYESETWIETPRGAERLAIPARASLAALVKGQLLIRLDADWTTPGGAFKAGALISVDAEEAIADPAALRPRLVAEPGPRQAIEGVAATKSYVLVDLYDNVRGGVIRYGFGPEGWRGTRLDLPGDASVDVTSTELESDTYFASVTGFLAPTTLWTGDAAAAAPPVRAKTLPPRFRTEGLATEQFEASSSDGTRIPYFVVRRKDARLDGSNPTLLYAYGGFMVSMTPAYSATVGKLWLEKGGVYVLANIRGGGEFGPAWHEAGLKTNRQRVFLEAISPYHALKPGAAYPEPLFITSTKDDRVHPGHARKMAARMEELGLPFLYYENVEGGHSAAANLQETARRSALEFAYLIRKLMD